MQAYPLIAHPSSQPLSIRAIEARINDTDPCWLQLRWRVDGSKDLLRALPAGHRRRDDLWRTTCFELFLQAVGATGYTEFNFSPSQAWNAYDFDGIRQGMRERAVNRSPVLTMRPGTSFAIFDAAIPRSMLFDAPCSVGLTAVMEETGGHKTYWALAHRESDAPDFHQPACFAASLAAPLRT